MMTSSTEMASNNVIGETDDLSKAKITSIDDSIKFIFDLSEVHGKNSIQKFKLALKKHMNKPTLFSAFSEMT